MVSSVGRCPIVCLVGSLVALGCGADALSIGGFDTPMSAAVSGSVATQSSAGASGASGWPAQASAGSGYEGAPAGSGGAVAGKGGAPAAIGSAAGSQAGSPSMAGAGGSVGSGRPRRRGGAGAAAQGGGGSSGMRGSGDSTTRAGTGGRPALDGGAGDAADGCVQNLACQLTAEASSGDVHQDCVDRINQFRRECACLPPLERWLEGEDCADEMAKYDSAGTEAHAAFGAGICEGGSAQNECPGWRSEEQIVSVCLQRMWDEGPPPMSDCNGSCFQMYGHFLNMTNQRMTKVACGFHEREDGQIWSVQNFTR